MAQDVRGRIKKVRQLMEERGYDGLVLRNNPDLRWLTGAERTFDEESAHTAFITQKGLWLLSDSRYLNTFKERGVGKVWELCDDPARNQTGWVAGLARKNRCRVLAIEDSLTVGWLDGLERSLAERSVACLLPRLHDDIKSLRMVKDGQELELLQRAQDITDAAFDHICGFIEPGMTEKEIRAELEGYMLSHGADGLSFPSIIASGPNGANPHAQPGDRKVQRGDLIVMDYGAQVGDYHADMTRTVAVGEPNQKQREVYAVVREAHEKAAEAVRAGVKGADIHRIAAKVIADAGYGEYFGHGLGHGVGLEIHESPSFGLSWDAPVPEGSVVTIEPGIYLPGEFGIRLEDFGVVTRDGYEPFTGSTHDLVVVDNG